MPSFVNARNHCFNNEASHCDMPGPCAILVGGVCDLLNLENYSTKSFTLKTERYTVATYFSVTNFGLFFHHNLISLMHIKILLKL